MNVAIIGAGNVGRAVAVSATRAGHQVTITSSGGETATSVAAQTGATVANGNVEAVLGADLVVLAVPVTALPDLARELGRAVDGKPVLDTSNRPTPDPSGATGPTSIAEEIQAALPKAHVIKALNTAFSSRQAEPQIDGVPVDGFVAGDDDAAKATALAFIESLGFSPVDAGPLVNARTLEGMAWLNISINLRGGSWQGGWKILEPTAVGAAS
jgi:8-hydroxy-5-deazaflavin:NADPH oxidoreductase